MTSTARFQIPGVPSAVATAREAVTEAVAARVRGDQVETVRLLVSELVTNGIIHGRSDEPLEISLRCAEGKLRVEVVDRGPGFVPQPRAIAPDVDGGWGLYLVEQLADRWGVARDGHTCVWFELSAADQEH